MISSVINIAKKHNCALIYYPRGSNKYNVLNNNNNATVYIIYSECYQYISSMTPNMQPFIVVEIFETNEWKIPFGYKKLYEIFLESNTNLSNIDEFLTNNIQIQTDNKLLTPETQNSVII